MDRKEFVRKLAMVSLTHTLLTSSSLDALASLGENSELMPALFLGHGSPMYAIQENEFTRNFRMLGKTLPWPKAILCISAHWETRGTFITAMEKPKTIHDFGGFPDELFRVQYPAPGSPEVAKETMACISTVAVEADYSWGLDHGCWSVLKHLYPAADIPVVQLSLDYRKPPEWHFNLAKELGKLRRKGILIIGSGNIVHNLGMISWSNKGGFEWAQEANEKIKELIRSGDHRSLINYPGLGRAVQLAVPTPDHYLPLLYALALQEKNEEATFFNDKTELGSLSMTSVRIMAT